jgi:hypothetical protein
MAQWNPSLPGRMTPTTLWDRSDPASWKAALDAYETVIAQQGVRSLPEHDRWYRKTLPALVQARSPMYATLDEFVRLTEWKMARGVWRARNLVLVRSNTPESVIEVSRTALQRAPDPLAPIRTLATLSGVGPATASALAAAALPGIYPFLDDLVATQIPGLPKVAYTLGYYGKYAAALRARAEQLGPGWTPDLIERALWAFAGGKVRATMAD